MLTKPNRILQMLAGRHGNRCLAGAQDPAPLPRQLRQPHDFRQHRPRRPRRHLQPPQPAFHLRSHGAAAMAAARHLRCRTVWQAVRQRDLDRASRKFQTNPCRETTRAGHLSNGQFFLQKATEKYQYYVQVGAYTMPTLGVPFTNAQNT